MRLITLRLLLLGLAAAAMAVPAVSYGQGNDIIWVGGDGDYDSTSNWDLFFVPDTSVDARGIINNSGTARVSTSVVDTAQTVLGQNGGDAGSLIIENGGSLGISFSDDNSFNPGIDVGVGGVGTFEVQAGGAFSAGYLSLGGAGSTAAFSGAVGNLATVQIGLSASQPGQFGTTIGAGNSLRVTGPHVDFSSNSFQVNSGGTFVAEITDSASHSVISSSGVVTVGGTLQVEFNGVTPSAGDAWNLFDAASIDGQFDQIVLPGAPSLPAGQVYAFKTVADAGSTNGEFGQLSVEQRLTLKVNRATNEISIVGGSAPVGIDGYLIQSQLGGLNATNWNSLQNQAVGDWRESPQGGSSTLVAEFKPTTSTPVSDASPVELGGMFNLPTATEFGTELEDITFEYYTPDGETVVADVVYEGTKQHNNLVLLVDPVDGEAILQNQSSLSVTIDGYTIHSDSGSLLPGDGDWMSLEDDNIDTWRESNPTASDLTELRSSGATTLSGGGAPLNLGSPFLTVGSGGTEDLTFSYLLEGDTQFTQAIVVYGDISFEDVSGDYNGDGVVDSIDYAVWREALGDSVTPGTGADGSGDGLVNQDDFTIWLNNYGSTGLSGSESSTPAAAPEPTALLLLAVGLSAFGTRKRQL